MARQFKETVFFVLVALLVVGIAIAGFSGKVKAQAKAPIKVGVVAPLSGNSADMGIPVKEAVELAFKELNEKGGISGRKVELIVFDDEAKPDKGTSLVQRLIENDKVVAVLGPCNTAVALATVKVTQQAKVPQIVPVAQDPRVLDPIHPYTFRVTETFVDDAKKIVDYLIATGYKKPALIYDSTASGLGGKAVIKKLLEEKGMPLVAETTHDLGVTDMTAQTISLRKAQPDVVITWSLGAEVAMFMKTLKQVGWVVPVVGHRGLAFPILLKLGGSAVEGMIFTDAIDENKSETKTFLDKFQKVHGWRPDQNAFAALGWDAAQVLILGLTKANSDDRTKVRDAIESIEKHVGAGGRAGSYISFSPTKHEGPTGNFVVMRTIKGGKFVTLEKQ